ncbi:OmpA family protein [Luteolibacter yonseiensis]|uniref:OmpA family protein n=1 Tax=Luteolibacter yonseiensis TaxID=1144680 RepID=A0A934R1P6_9BACT|nr:OmpA family protein [Luteolibacter yonseiensis]MBK1814832.1 OmpA family protein [Luteolibacter yonseiensis]
MHPRSKLPYFFLGLAALLATSAVVMLATRLRVKNPELPPAVPTQAAEPVAPPKIEGLTEPAKPEDPDKVLADLGIGVAAADPAVLVSQIATALEAGDLAKVARLIGKDALDPETTAKLKLMASTPLRLRQPDGVREVGELELNARSRWALELDGAQPGRDSIFLDLRRLNGRWAVERLTLPPGPGEPIPKAVFADSLGVADAFLQAVLRQDFEFARDFVDPATVSDAKIAGLCILFEEGEYRMRKTKPLRSMFQREDTVGYLANVETKDGKQSAQFGINMIQPPTPSNWIVSEINLNQLLADYARRVAGGDIYYSPLVKNPAGGDTLALYFEFDEDEMNPRTRRQLEIVTMILKADPGKKITLSGHTDALGTEDYNNSLSTRRADVVRDYLSKAGVSPSQIVTVGKGASQPRRPNITESGMDNPEGRRANRRTEIYLDF